MDWIKSWVETIRLWLFDRETYDYLVTWNRDGEWNPDDWTEADRPEAPSGGDQ